MLKGSKGQTLIELVVGLGVSLIMIGAAISGVLIFSRSNRVTEQGQTAAILSNSLLDNAATMAQGNWSNIYNLSKGADNTYFTVGTPTTTVAAIGQESILSGDVTYGLVGHWKFDESSGSSAYDSSGKGNYGVLTNSPTRTASASCKAGQCLSFDGTNDYVDAGNAASNARTVSFWLKRADALNRDIIDLGTPEIKISSDAIVASGFTSPTYYVDGAVGSAISGTDWHYIAVTDTANINADNVDIGKAALNYFYGLIDDVRIYNRALTADEISKLYGSYVYTRYFYVDNVSRDSTQAIESTYNSANNHPSTQKITVSTSWNASSGVSTTTIVSYLTRWVNNAATQTDWGGSSGVSGPVTDFGSNYYESHIISTSTAGSIKISGL